MKKVIRLYFSFQFFFSLLLWLPIFYEFQKRIGLNDSEIFSIQSIYYTVFCLLEIPTGLLADRLGYRLCMGLGGGVVALSNLLPIFAPTYGGMLFHFILIALGRSLISGSSSAYIFEYIKRHSLTGQPDEYKKIEGRARSYSLFGKVLLWGMIGSLMQWHLTLPYWLSFVGTGISVFFAIALPSLGNLSVPSLGTLSVPSAGTLSGSSDIKPKWNQDFKAITGLLRTSPVLVLIMLQGVALFTAARIAQVNLFQPILKAKAFGVPSFGWIMSLMTLFEALGSAWPHGLRSKLTDWNAVFFLTLTAASALSLIPFSAQIATIACLCIFSLANGFAFPIQKQLLNQAITVSRYRATLLSIESIVDRAVCAWVALLLGSYMKSGAINAFLIHSSLATIVFMIIIFTLGRMQRARASSRLKSLT